MAPFVFQAGCNAFLLNMALIQYLIWSTNFFVLALFCAIFQNLFHKQTIYMNTNLIYKTVSQKSLYFDQSILDEIKIFIDTFIGDCWEINAKLNILVCTAIVCQCKRVPAVQASINVPFGLTIQNVMKCTPQIQKELFLNTAKSIAEKWPTCPHQFLNKIQSLKLGYRIFKKYRLACKLIGQKFNIDPYNNESISNLFWIVYLIARHNHKQSEELQITTCVVPMLISQVYGVHLQLGNMQAISEIISKIFSMAYPSNKSNKQILLKYQRQFLKIITQTYSKRFSQKKTKFNFLLNKPLIINRLVDDLNNIYSEIINNSAQFFMDQMSFLQLNKDIAPQSFHLRNNTIINQKICFESNQMQKLSIQEPSTPKRGSQRNEDSLKINSLQTPLTTRMQNMAWIRDCIQSLKDSNHTTFQNYFAKYNINTTYKQFIVITSNVLEKIIKKFSPSCKDLIKRKAQIYKFFVYCITIGIQMYGQQMGKIFQTNLGLFSIFCLSTEMFNFIYQAYSGHYAQYCQIFQVDFVNAFWPINWFGYYIKLPKTVDDHLYELQRRLLLKQIWQSDLGFRIMTNKEKMVPINQLRMKQRLQQHTKCRIDEICRSCSISQRLFKKVFNMVIQLIQKKPLLLKNNNIDQLIICSITACLAINQVQNKFTLQKVFSFYQRVHLSSSANKQKLFNYQKQDDNRVENEDGSKELQKNQDDQSQLNIFDFYNEVFLKDVDQVMHQYPQSATFLLTPKRLQLMQRNKQGVLQFTPLAKKCRQKQCGFVKKSGENLVNNDSTSKYQLNLVKNIKIKKQAESEMQAQGQGINQNEQHGDDKQMVDQKKH